MFFDIGIIPIVVAMTKINNPKNAVNRIAKIAIKLLNENNIKGLKRQTTKFSNR